MVNSCEIIGLLPEPIGDVPALVMGQQLLLFGGGCGHRVSDIVFSLDPHTGKTEDVGRIPYSSRGHQVVQLGEDLYLMGGFDQGTKDEFWRLDLKGGRSTRLKPMPSDNAWFSAVVHDSSIVVMGGYSIPNGYIEDLFVYDPASDNWVIHHKAFDERIFPNGRVGGNTVFCMGDELISCGGADSFKDNRANALNVTGSYNLKHKEWKPMDWPIRAREGLVSVQKDHLGFLIGGQSEASEQPSSLIEKVDLNSGKTVTIAQLSEGRVTPAVGLIGDRLLIAGGVTKPLFEMTDKIEMLLI